MARAESKNKLDVLLFGLGAIGGFYSFIVASNDNVRLTVAARSNYDAVKAEGLQIDSENHGTHVVEFHNVVKDPNEATQPFDYIICANKAINQDAIATAFRLVVNDETTFVLIQNGVGNEEPFRKAYPRNTIISCLAWVWAIQPTPGHIKQGKSENTELGLFHNDAIPPSTERARLDGFADLLRGGRTPFTVEDNIQIKRWEKVVWNVAWNPLTTLMDVDTQTWLKSSDEATPMTRRLMQDVIDVARHCGVPIGDDLIDRLLARILAMPPIYSSMHTDAKAGRPLEVEVIVGYPMKKAKEFGMNVPTLSAVYAMIMAVNGRLMEGKS